MDIWFKKTDKIKVINTKYAMFRFKISPKGSHTKKIDLSL